MDYAKSILGGGVRGNQALVIQGSQQRVCSVKEAWIDEQGRLLRRIEICKTTEDDAGFFLTQDGRQDRENGIFVSKVCPGKISGLDGLLVVGDELIEVFGSSVKDQNLEDIAHTLKTSDNFTVVVRRKTRTATKIEKPSGHQPHSTIADSITSSINFTKYKNLGLHFRSSNKEGPGTRRLPKPQQKDRASAANGVPLSSSMTNLSPSFSAEVLNNAVHRVYTGLLTANVRTMSNFNVGKTETQKIRNVQCELKVDGEFKATAQTTMKNGEAVFDEIFDIELKNASECTASIYHAKGHTISLIAFARFHLERVFTEATEVEFSVKLYPIGLLSLSLKFVEASRLLIRAQSQKKRGVFGFPLERTLESERTTIPILVKKCVGEIEQRGLDAAGLYRKSAGEINKRKLMRAFDLNSETVDVSENAGVSVHVLTSVLKQYLRELPEPLLPSSAVLSLVAIKSDVSIMSSDEQIHKLKEVLSRVPESHRALISYLLDHLLLVVRHSETNLMDITNLAICFGPTLFSDYAPASNSACSIDINRPIDALTVLIKLWETQPWKDVESAEAHNDALTPPDLDVDGSRLSSGLHQKPQKVHGNEPASLTRRSTMAAPCKAFDYRLPIFRRSAARKPVRRSASL